ncbi:hypothetical protein N9U05_00355 [bacterium]|nr:hypothetical protein [bacterium]
MQKWDEELARQNELPQSSGEKIRIKLPGDTQVEVQSGASTAFQIGAEHGLVEQALVASVTDDEGTRMVDAWAPLYDDCELEFFDFSTKEGEEVFWHSAAHLLGQALEHEFGEGVSLGHGPPLDAGAGGTQGGFFYEMHLTDDRTVSESHFKALTKRLKRIVKQKQSFERMVVSRDTARDFFADNTFKLQLLDRIPPSETITLYKNGPFVDLCRGPHVPHTGLFKAMSLTKCSASHWQPGEGAEISLEEEATLLQRVYGIAFPSKDLMGEWNSKRAEAKKRDHRLIGAQQQLYFFQPISPGSAFMLPHGTHIFNKLVSTLRDDYVRMSYQEVMTPIIFKQDLWAQSGHLQNYRENMYEVRGATAVDAEAEGEKQHDDDAAKFGMKPMNCPAHCLIFNNTLRSYKELPMRLAEFSPLHRNELSGTLGGADASPLFPPRRRTYLLC